MARTAAASDRRALVWEVICPSRRMRRGRTKKLKAVTLKVAGPRRI
jgi:hypothetical protein